MREWLDRPMGATTDHGQEQGGQAPDKSEGPPQGAWREEPRDDPEQPQGANWGEWPQDRGWSRPKGSGWDNSARAYDHADNGQTSLRALGTSRGLELGSNAQ